ncbi:MAG: hypothetical protein L0312_11745 [Acidobacteria bacterium]|nr:hypothetical protein [Acidobacteriota bacterium]
MGNAEEIVGEHNGTDEQLEPLPAFSQMRPAMPDWKHWPFLKAGLFSIAGRSAVLFLPRRGIEISWTPASWQAVRLWGL